MSGFEPSLATLVAGFLRPLVELEQPTNGEQGNARAEPAPRAAAWVSKFDT